MIAIISAEPNWSLLHPSLYVGNTNPFEPCDLEAILAWRIETTEIESGPAKGAHCEQVTPIAVLGSEFPSSWIVAPDGTVTDCFTIRFSSIDGALEYLREGPADGAA